MRKVSILLFTLISIFGEAQSYDTVKIRPQKVSENLYMLFGSGGNIGVLTGPDGVFMIDDQFAPLSEKISAAIHTLDPGTIRFLVNTHLHGDHSGGNENFRKLGVTIVAQNNVRDRMRQTSTNRIKTQTFPARDKEAWPVVTFPDKINFHLNDEDIEVLYFGPGHTDGDVFIHFKNANVYHCGDSFVRYGYPYIDLTSGGSLNGFIANLDRLIAMTDEQSKIIPGHGALAKRTDVQALRNMVVSIRDDVAAAMKNGKKREDIPALGITDKYDAQYGGGFIKGKDFVLMAAESLTAEKGK